MSGSLPTWRQATHEKTRRAVLRPPPTHLKRCVLVTAALARDTAWLTMQMFEIKKSEPHVSYDLKNDPRPERWGVASNPNKEATLHRRAHVKKISCLLQITGIVSGARRSGEHFWAKLYSQKPAGRLPQHAGRLQNSWSISRQSTKSERVLKECVQSIQITPKATWTSVRASVTRLSMQEAPEWIVQRASQSPCRMSRRCRNRVARRSERLGRSWNRSKCSGERRLLSKRPKSKAPPCARNLGMTNPNILFIYHPINIPFLCRQSRQHVSGRISAHTVFQKLSFGGSESSRWARRNGANGAFWNWLLRP